MNPAALAAAVILVAICAAGQFVALRAAHQAGEDGVALIRYLGATAEHPEDTSFLVEPRPEHNGFYGIDNLFDKKAPFIQSWTDGNTDTMTYDLLGRRGYVRLTYQFN